jgi:formylmethanofuran dehydrogenase subunit A
MVTWLLTSSKGYSMKVVNPGGVESWKWNQRRVDMDTPVPPFGVTPRKIVFELARAVDDLKLPHSMHIHANHLGEPGNYKTTLETMRTLEGLRTHFTHLQFHSYGMTKKGFIKSAAAEIADYLNEHPKFTCDIGQIIFGPATTMTSDAPMQFRLHQQLGNKWINSDIEMETGSGIVPLMYRPSILFNAVQWCIGLELLLLVKNPWQLVLTTDHPNAGPFTAYPQIIRLLMDKDYRQAIIEELSPRALSRTKLKDLDREYTIEEITIITRSAPAKILGLSQKGHLGTGADADVAIYRYQNDKEKMFANAEYVLKDGKIVVKIRDILASVPGRRFFVEPDASKTLLPDMVEDFKNYYTIQLSNFAVEDEYLLRPEEIPCG